MKTLVAGALLALVLAGCASAPQYKEVISKVLNSGG